MIERFLLSKFLKVLLAFLMFNTFGYTQKNYAIFFEFSEIDLGTNEKKYLENESLLIQDTTTDVKSYIHVFFVKRIWSLSNQEMDSIVNCLKEIENEEKEINKVKKKYKGKNSKKQIILDIYYYSPQKEILFHQEYKGVKQLKIFFDIITEKGCYYYDLITDNAINKYILETYE